MLWTVSVTQCVATKFTKPAENLLNKRHTLLDSASSELEENQSTNQTEELFVEEAFRKLGSPQAWNLKTSQYTNSHSLLFVVILMPVERCIGRQLCLIAV